MLRNGRWRPLRTLACLIILALILGTAVSWLITRGPGALVDVAAHLWLYILIAAVGLWWLARNDQLDIPLSPRQTAYLLLAVVLAGVVISEFNYAGDTQPALRQPHWLWSVLQPDTATITVRNDRTIDVSVKQCTDATCHGSQVVLPLAAGATTGIQVEKSNPVTLQMETVGAAGANLVLGCITVKPPAQVLVSKTVACSSSAGVS